MLRWERANKADIVGEGYLSSVYGREGSQGRECVGVGWLVVCDSIVALQHDLYEHR